MTTTAPRFLTRPARAADEAFLYSSFLRAFRESDQSEGIKNTEYFQTFKAQFGLVLRNFTVIVAHPEGEEDEIAGWIAFKGPVVAYVYTKKSPWRRTGVARVLWNAAGIGIECRALYASRWSLALAKQKGLKVSMASFVEGTRLLMGAG